MAAYKSRAIVLANGELGAQALQRADIQDEDFIVCVDGGLEHALAQGIQPHLIIGDFDSARSVNVKAASLAGVERISHPTVKDVSDLELALEELQQRNMKEVLLLGISGGRSDHGLFNWMLPALKSRPYRFRLLDETIDAQVVNRAHSLKLTIEPGCLVSLLPLREVTGVTTGGLEYALSNASIKPGSTIGLSNVVCAKDVSVELASGVLLVMINYNLVEQPKDD
ncbi:MAG: thiamine diphosphokinase [Granulosicoccaceae bacterium]